MAHAVGPLKVSGSYQIPIFREVVSNAAFVNVPPIPNPPRLLELSSGREVLFPFMNFTCNSGTITRLMFLWWQNGPVNADRLTSWPYFSLWHPLHYDGGFMEVSGIGPYQLMGSLDVMLNRNNHYDQLVEVTLTGNIPFNNGDILGVRLQQSPDSSASNGISMTVLEQSEDHNQTLACWRNIYTPDLCYTQSSSFQENPYIAIETGET